MESRLKADFSDVEIHTDAQAARSARTVSANAYTVGNHVVFGSGAYAPGTETGRRTIAHELTHIVQQRRGAVEGTLGHGGISVSHPADRFEQQAARTAALVMAERRGAPMVGAKAQRERSQEDDPVQSDAQRQGANGEEETQEQVQPEILQRQGDQDEEEEEDIPVS
jgi:hypothetical protein